MKRNGVSLVEVIIVVGILGVLTALILGGNSKGTQLSSPTAKQEQP
jgi:prepilin-type N-terminal cleavage/methylation domain-containing protein